MEPRSQRIFQTMLRLDSGEQPAKMPHPAYHSVELLYIKYIRRWEEYKIIVPKERRRLLACGEGGVELSHELKKAFDRLDNEYKNYFHFSGGNLSKLESAELEVLNIMESARKVKSSAATAVILESPKSPAEPKKRTWRIIDAIFRIGGFVLEILKFIIK